MEHFYALLLLFLVNLSSPSLVLFPCLIDSRRRLEQGNNHRYRPVGFRWARRYVGRMHAWFIVDLANLGRRDDTRPLLALLTVPLTPKRSCALHEKPGARRRREQETDRCALWTGDFAVLGWALLKLITRVAVAARLLHASLNSAAGAFCVFWPDPLCCFTPAACSAPLIYSLGLLPFTFNQGCV